ncbi:hypothetical protein EV702DRAFT_548159 [Suillus placidus]|uniref:Uncharacterized protein n=1 Tax=Suillus placidus TaxID=48579 RepID=A0A9P6ZPX6_9AGAM|nr:hypothetical protein EV702DRAFT_548159 [Suillus placidus]
MFLRLQSSAILTLNATIIHQGAAMVNSLTEKLGSLPAEALILHIDEFFQRAREFYPSDKITELRKSVDSVASTATTLYQVIKEAAERRGIPLYPVLSFSILLEMLKEQFPPPNEAPGHEKRMAMINTVLDRVEECFLQVIGKLGMNKELLKSLSSSLKSGVKHIIVTIGDIDEQHPALVSALLSIVISMLFAEVLSLSAILRIVGFGSLGPVKGETAAWLQGLLFGPAVPKGDWFGRLQRLAMIRGKAGAKL